MLYGGILLIVLGGVFFYLDSKLNTVDECNYDSENYIGKNVDECSTVQVLCAEGFERFDDSCGCGCKPVEDLEKTFCNEDQRNVGACITIYQPVCGWDDPEKINCLTYPCATTYSNSCSACSNENVLYHTEGECPVGN